MTHKGEIPLSYEQQRLYFVQQLESDSWHYNIPYALRMTGPLEVQPLERSLAEIITRHEVLRTTFSLVDGNPVQIVGPPQQLILPLLDLTSLSQSEAERELRRLLDDQARQLFDLMRGPVVRACLVRLQSSEHVLALTLHHIVSDAWSMEVMARELGLLYDAFAQGKESPLPKLLSSTRIMRCGSANGCKGKSSSGSWATGNRGWRERRCWSCRAWGRGRGS